WPRSTSVRERNSSPRWRSGARAPTVASSGRRTTPPSTSRSRRSLLHDPTARDDPGQHPGRRRKDIRDASHIAAAPAAPAGRAPPVRVRPYPSLSASLPHAALAAPAGRARPAPRRLLHRLRPVAALGGAGHGHAPLRTTAAAVMTPSADRTEVIRAL